MSVAFHDPIWPAGTRALALAHGPLTRAFALREGRVIELGRFLADVQALAVALPAGTAAINLCEDRYAFLVAFCALICQGRVNLLPPSRTPQAVAEVLASHPGAFVLSERALDPEPPRLHRFTPGEGATACVDSVPRLPPEQLVAIGYTSGSTGVPKANPKTWSSFCASTARNAALLGMTRFDAPAHLLATVPPQHMYGLETSVLLPLLSACAVDAARPLFPADIARALAQLPQPRVLVTTPVHLRALVSDRTALPKIERIVSATAPLTQELAAEAERLWLTEVIEVFGSTETCVIAHRRTAIDDQWKLYGGVSLKSQPDGTLVDADYLAAPVVLQDIVEQTPPDRFRLCGRSADLLEIAGKRASLGDLTRRLLALDGVQDGVVFQLDEDSAGVRRIAALVVSPGRSEAELIAELRHAVDPAFLPRPLKRVAALPRNETGKLPRQWLLQTLCSSAPCE